MFSGEKVLAANSQKKALEQEPENISVLFDLATTYDQAGQLENEISLLKKIHRDNPKAVQPLVRLRDAFLKQEDWKNILAAQDKILPLIRDNKDEWEEELKNKSRFLFARGKQNWEKDKRDLAITDIKQALKAWNKNSDAHIFLGDAYLETGKPKVALKQWFTGFEQTRDVACLIRAQKAYLEMKDPKDLIEIYQKAIDPNQPKESYIYVLLLAVLYLEHQQAENAKNILEEHQTGKELLGSILLAHARKPNSNEADLNLIRKAVFQLSTRTEKNLQ